MNIISCSAEICKNSMYNRMVKIERMSNLETTGIGGIFEGFRLVKKEYVESKRAELYTMRHEKTGAELLYFDRADENKTFAISFLTLPEDNTGVFHILEHSVLSGSEKFPVKEPFVSMLQSSMQTFLNAMTYGDKTVFPVSSRNEQDLFNLMAVYLDGVFHPLIYSRPEIFMQEGWHYEYEEGSDVPAYYNGVVLNEMKGVFSDVDELMNEEMCRLLYPDTCYGYTSGGHPDYIPELTYQKFIETHKRFYHPSNARIMLDGHMDIARFLHYIDTEYLSQYEYQEHDFEFTEQTPKRAERTIHYEAQPGEEGLSHLMLGRILGSHADVEKAYAARVLADYLIGSNEAPLKRAFLDQGLAQDIEIGIMDDMYQPMFSLVVRNTTEEQFTACRACLMDTVKQLLADGLDQEVLLATIARMEFFNREIHEPYGVELVERALQGWLYGDDPLTYIDNAGIYDVLRKKVAEGYFETLLQELLGNPDTLSCLYVLPSLTKGEEDAAKEDAKLQQVVSAWDDERCRKELSAFGKMQAWQQSMDSEEAMASLPHLELSDVNSEIKPVKTSVEQIAGTEVVQVDVDTNGIAYVHLHFDLSDFTIEELRMTSVWTSFFGELRTEHISADKLQTKIKALFGRLSARVMMIARKGERDACKPYLVVSAKMLEKNIEEAFELLKEILLYGRYDETERIYEGIVQSDYMLKQQTIAEGHQLAITKALAGCSMEDSLREALEGESFLQWFSSLAASYQEHAAEYTEQFQSLCARAFTRNRLIIGGSVNLALRMVQKLVEVLPEKKNGVPVEYPVPIGRDAHIEIPASVGFSAKGYNLYEAGGEFFGAWAVLGSLMSYGYLWNMVRVQGGAYGTGMGVQMNGDIFCYSYRDPDIENTKMVYEGMSEFLSEFVQEDMPLTDMIIGTLNTIDPLLSPEGICDQECMRYMKGITDADIEEIRRQILATTNDSLKSLVNVLQIFEEKGIFCAVSGKPQTDSAK